MGVFIIEKREFDAALKAPVELGLDHWVPERFLVRLVSLIIRRMWSGIVED